MKFNALWIVLSLLVGIAIGWIGKGAGSGDPGDNSHSDEGMRDRRSGIRAHGTLTSSSDEVRWLPDDERVFLTPETEGDHAAVRRLIRGALEQEKRTLLRMKAVCDLLYMMTPENAHDIRDAFRESWDAGFDLGWERSIFLSRYGEIMGARGADEFQDDGTFDFLLIGWSRMEPDAAVEWVNQMESEKKQLRAIRHVMYGAGQLDLDYGLKIFESLDQSGQQTLKRDLFRTYQRGGGTSACAELSANLLARDDEHLRAMGEYILNKTFTLIRGSGETELTTWLRGLPPEHIALLNSAELPAEFRSNESEGTRE